MTWSIVARDPASGAFGVAVATKFFAVGAICPYVKSGVGAIASQAMINPLYGTRGLRLLGEGVAPDRVVAQLLADDDGSALRQIHIVDAKGRMAQHTGQQCIEWCGHVARDAYSVAGNMLAGPQVIAATADAYAANSALPFPERLIRAMHAGEAAGGDKRGKQSAALCIHTTEEYPFLDLRVDDHVEPLRELDRLLGVAHERFIPFFRCMPTHDRPAGIFDRAAIDAEVARYQAERAKR